ncbi:hypothetical protein AWR36_004795 [Microbulbifer flavimaris]|uniref:DNA replication terminus site binding protein n=2 Tax=Microbulbiferaceae TaxID=1706373 RepID=A0ABX4I3X8_9GAMM|nr:hypothetical protein AVO43_04795 [Microbulbifer sp. ZGT114]PCO07139.1 hypothetical protein AWR36_004795 [Microbulbifer flavimaris]
MATGEQPPQSAARRLPQLLDELHRAASALEEQLQPLEQRPRPYEHYLLQPSFARHAAEELEGSFERPFALAGALFARLSYGEDAGSDARTTLQIPGLLCVPAETIALASRLNEVKLAFASTVKDFREAGKPRPDYDRDRQLRDLFAQAGYPRLHLRQCYRQILLCPERPDALALSWIKARKSIRKVTPDWCERKLVQIDPQGADPGIQYQRQLLAGLHPSQHEDLRQVQVQSRPNLQVAEIFRGEDGERYHQVGYAAMPVLVVSDESRELPDYSRVGDEPPEGRRRQRRDLSLDREPFLPALRVHLRHRA